MQPRWYQTEAVAAAWAAIRRGVQSPLIVTPTGSGKSLIAAMLAEESRRWGGRVLIVAHRKELLEQNHEKIRLLIPDEPVGIYSAGLNSRDTESDVLCCGIQSVYSRAHELGRRDIVIVDECHLIPPEGDGMYQQFLRELRALCPHVRLIGMTATPYRCGSGPLTGPTQMFDQIVYEVSVSRLIEDGYLCSLISRAADSQTDTSAITIRGGEFVASSMIQTFNTTGNVSAAVAETVTRVQDRNSVLIFCSGVAHAEAVAEEIRSLTGQTCGVVTGDTPPMERSATLRQFREQKLKFVANCDVLTTGFDAPCIDAIAVLRATLSPGLFAQMVGRGLRKDESKVDCLILDFGGNIKRHGPIDSSQYGRASLYSGDGKNSDPVEKNGRGMLCPNCEADVPARSVSCYVCGFEFPGRHDDRPDDESSILGEAEPVWYEVQTVRAIKHHKKKAPDAPPTLRVIYTCVPTELEPEDDSGFGNLEEREFSEWLCFEHEGFALTKAQQWWDRRSTADTPIDVDDAILCWQSVLNPRRILVGRDGKWDRIVDYDFDGDDPPDAWTLAGMPEEELPF